MHSIGKVILEAAVSTLVKEGVSAVVRGVTSTNDKKVKQGQSVVKDTKCECGAFKSKLDGFAKKDLLASISFFNEGFLYLCKAFEEVNLSDDCTVTAVLETAHQGGFPSSTAWREVLFLAEGLKDLNDSATSTLCDAKKRFEDARRKATKAFYIEALPLKERILAMRYRVAATILEKIDNPAEALPACRLCLEELHSTQMIQGRFFQESIIRSDVRDVNSFICDVTQIVSGGGALLAWPCISCNGEKIDPLHDRTMTHFCETWSFGQGGEKEHKLKFAWSIASNSHGHFIVGDRVDRNIKVFDVKGVFLNGLDPFVDELQSEYEHEIWNVCCDQQDNIYVLAMKRNHEGKACWSEVFVFDKHPRLTYKFNLREGFRGYSMTVDEFNRVLIIGGSLAHVHNDAVEVYESDGAFLQCFGKKILNNAQDIAAAYDGHSLVLDADDKSTCIRVFSAEGYQLNRFSVRASMPDSGSAVGFHPASENVLVASLQSENKVEVSMYSKEFKLVRVIHFKPTGGLFITGIAATVKGHIAVPCKNTVLFA